MQEFDIEQTEIKLPVEDNSATQVSFGKFKSAEALLSAYNNLEKEFTKKSQQLKTFSKSECELESLFKNSPILSCYAEELSAKLTSGLSAQDSLNAIIAEKFVEPAKIYQNEELLDNFVYKNENITGKIIADYLDSISEKKMPKSITTKGHISVSPPHRPKSLEEAGKIAKELLYNKQI